MKRCYLSLLFACLLLAGCTGKAEEAACPVQTEAVPVSAAPPAGLYDPDNPLEERYGGALRAYPLSIPDVSALKAMGRDLLVFSDTKVSTVITRLSGEDLYIAATVRLEFPLSGDDPSVRVTESGLSYFDPVNRQTVVLDTSLREILHIPAPEELVGTPLLSDDRNTLYYCSETGICAWDMETGIRRMIKEAAFDTQSVTGLHLNDTVLQCRVADREGNSSTLLLSTQDGRLLYEGAENLIIESCGSSYFVSFPTGCTRTLLFGQVGDTPLALTPADLGGEGFFLETVADAVSACAPSDSEIRLDYYDLETGSRRCSLTLPTSRLPLAVEETVDGWVYLLIPDGDYGRETIYRWDTASPEFALSDTSVYTGTYYTAVEPDYHGLVWCQSYAEKIGETYGIEVLLWEDALAVQPWDYDFEMEYLVPVLRQELDRLDQRLANFPEGFLEATASHFTSVKICLVRGITGSAESGSLDTATGIQFQEGTDAYIVLAAGDSSEKALYHELYHVMETHILGNSIALDQWAKLNPVGFEYDYDYPSNAQRDGSEYLQPDTRSFVDTYSMSFPKEDRARILECAMTEGNEALFAASPLQYKLKVLCQGIREAYGLEKSGETYLWEQYLVQPLAYRG
ncbi:MAG: hypothetical protein ACI3V5_10720 [Faecousia sp.]